MLLGAGERPRASGMQPAAAQATNGLVIDVRHAVAQLWASNADAIKAACGPHVPTGLVDEIDVLAWLTADVLGRPLLHADDTNAVGKRIAAHASRVEKRLRVEAESTRKAVAKARASAAKKPELLPKVAAAEEAGKKERAVLLEKPYDAQLPATTVGEKRPASHWRQRAVDETYAKVAKLASAAITSCKLAAAAAACCERMGDKFLKLPRGSQVQQKAYAAYETAFANCHVAENDMEAAAAVAHEAVAAANEAIAAAREAGAAAEAVEAVDAESEGEADAESEGAADDCLFDIVNTMTLAVSMKGAGFADCAGCAMLALQRADYLSVYDDRVDEYSSYHLGCSEFLDHWVRSRLFYDISIEARHMASASGFRRPSDCAERCARCAGSEDGWLTMAGKQEVIRAFQAGERARTVVREQGEWLLLGLGADP